MLSRGTKLTLMDLKRINALYKKVVNQIDALRLSEAFNTVSIMLEESRLIEESRRLSQMKETYRYLIHYLLEGVRDDNRSHIITDICERLRTMSDLSLREAKTPADPGYYYELLRFNKYREEHMSEILKEYGSISSEMELAEAVGNDDADMRRRREETMQRLFNTLLTSLGADKEYKELTGYLQSGYADENISSLALSAITLSLLCFYDRGKMNVLLDIYEGNQSDKLRARALTGIVISLIFNGSRVESDATMMARMSLWTDSDETYRHLMQVIKVIIGTRDTERVAEKMKNEVIPELMKLRPEILKSLNKEEGELDAAMLENNPEWEELLEKSNLTKKMQELSEMQSDGADLMMVTFSNLKQFPFFNSAANWFMPFDPRHTELRLETNMISFIEMLRNASGLVCDSDLYSLALAFARMPEPQRQMISGQMSEQVSQLKEAAKSEELKTGSPQFDTETLKYVRDLYRFFKLFRKREGFADPFAKPLNFIAMPIVGKIMDDAEVLRLIGEFYFKRGYYGDALPLLTALCEDEKSLDSEDAALWEKIGFCHQSAGKFHKALDAYDKASLLKTPGPWLTNKLAYVNRRLGNYAEAAACYSRALEMDPDNVTLLMNAGNMLLEAGDISGALTNFYHANYIISDNPKIMRAVAWTELLNGNLTKSRDYYGKIISREATASDYLNVGHVSVLMKEYKEAVNYYRLSAKENREEFELAFKADINTLVKAGADRETLLLLLDAALRDDSPLS